MIVMDKSAVRFWHGKELDYDVAYIWRNHSHEHWSTVTYSEIIKKKTKKQLSRLDSKRKHDKIVPCYIWVFKNEGFIHGGWYLYLKTLKDDFGLSWYRYEKGERENIMNKIRQNISLGILPFQDSFELWCERFAEVYRHIGFKRHSNQGILPAWVKVNKYNEPLDIFF